MRKFLMVLALFLVAAPVFAQTNTCTDPSATNYGQPLPCVYPPKSVASNDCLVFPSGKKVCMSQDGQNVVMPGSVVIEGGGRVYAPNGVTAGGTSYIGDPYGHGGIVTGPGGMVVKGGVANITANGLFRSFPLMGTSGSSFRLDFEPQTTSDQGSVQVSLPSEFQVISNLDPATKGAYDAIALFESGGWEIVPLIDKFPDHLVVRSKSGKAERFFLMVLATGDGFKAAGHSITGEVQDPAKILQDMRSHEDSKQQQ